MRGGSLQHTSPLAVHAQKGSIPAWLQLGSLELFGPCHSSSTRFGESVWFGQNRINTIEFKDEPFDKVVARTKSMIPMSPEAFCLSLPHCLSTIWGFAEMGLPSGKQT